MIGKLRTYLKEGFTYFGLEITGPEENRSYFLMELHKDKTKLLIKTKEKLNGLHELSQFLKRKDPLFLCINTPNILTKIADIENNSVEAMVNHAFPNIDLNGIYYQIIQSSTNPIVTISKKTSVDTLLKEIDELQLLVFEISLGISPMESILPYLEEESVHASNHELQISDKSIVEIKKGVPENNLLYTINGLELSSSHLLPFAQILGNLRQKTNTSNFGEMNEGLRNGLKNYRIFDQVLKFALLFFIVMLLANFLMYNHHHEEVGKLNEVLAATSSQKEELTLLDESVKRKQERVETLSASVNSRATYYLDLFAQHIPKSILLSEIKYQPLAKPVRQEKPIMLEEEVLLVSGISKNVDAFSLWIEELEKQDWVNSVETLDYNYVGKTTSNFLIEIGFHEDR